MSANWKDRYTDEQLEKKRRADRLNQQRLRRESKRPPAELAAQAQSSIHERYAEIVHCLLKENSALRATINRYRSRMGEIRARSQECLDCDSVSNETEPSAVHDAPASIRQYFQHMLVRDANHLPPISQHSSIYFHALIFTKAPGPGRNSSVSMEAILESVITWKLSSNNGLGSQFAIELFALSQSSGASLTADQIEWQISSSKFYDNLVQALIADRPFPTTQEGRHDQLPSGHLVEAERQKRLAALCSYQSIRPYRPFFASRFEWSAIFWSIFKYAEFLNFPTIGTLKETPYCLWPTYTQFSQRHPSFIDFLIWPRLREAMAANPHEYEPKSLCLNLVQNFELEMAQNASEDPIFVTGTDVMDVKLSPGMREIVYNPQRFHMRKGFKQKYPDLAACFPTEDSQGDISAERGCAALPEDPSGNTKQMNPCTSFSKHEQPGKSRQVEDSVHNQGMLSAYRNNQFIDDGSQGQLLDLLSNTGAVSQTLGPAALIARGHGNISESDAQGFYGNFIHVSNATMPLSHDLTVEAVPSGVELFSNGTWEVPEDL